MTRKYYIIFGIAVMMIAGCEEGDNSAAGGAKAKAAKTNKKMIVPDPDVFLASPLATPLIRTGNNSSVPGLNLSPLEGNDPLQVQVVATNDQPTTLSSPAASRQRRRQARIAAIPEPVTAMLSLMGLGALGMAMRRRVA